MMRMVLRDVSAAAGIDNFGRDHNLEWESDPAAVVVEMDSVTFRCEPILADSAEDPEVIRLFADTDMTVMVRAGSRLGAVKNLLTLLPGEPQVIEMPICPVS